MYVQTKRTDKQPEETQISYKNTQKQIDTGWCLKLLVITRANEKLI